MLTPELKKDIDQKWDGCWPLSLLKPIAIPDLISYLFFLKKISENHPPSERAAKNEDSPFFHSNDREGLERGIIKEMEPENMQTLFASDKGSVDLVKKYSRSLAFGAFVKGGLLVTPTQKSLTSVVGIMKIIEDAPPGEKGKIFDYLLHKKDLSGPNGQAYLPKYLVNLIVSIIQPGEKDLILDPSAGDGSLLVASAQFLAGKDAELNEPDPRKFVGLESDLTSLRIAGMNMMLHGINNPELKATDTSSGLSAVTIEQPTIIMANLIFAMGENRMVVEGSSIKEATRKEILYLKFILKNAAPTSRIVVIVPDLILYNNATEFFAMRQEIVDRFKVEAVISLNDKLTPQFFGTSIIIFSKKAAATTEKVWFYKIEQCRENENNQALATDDRPAARSEDLIEQRDELAEILNHFKNKDHADAGSDPDGFYIEAGMIRAKNYSLSYSEYNLFKDQEKEIHESKITDTEKKEAIKTLKNQTVFRSAEKIPEPKKSKLKKVILISCLSILVLGLGFGGYWVLYLDKDRFFPQKKESAAVPVADTSVPDTAPETIRPVTTVTLDTISKSNANQITEAKKPPATVVTRYTVKSDKAYFYRSPDTATRRQVYVNNLVHAVLIPKEERNGFVYVNYTNRLGEVTRGWLDKNDLKILP